VVVKEAGSAAAMAEEKAEDSAAETEAGSAAETEAGSEAAMAAETEEDSAAETEAGSEEDLEEVAAAATAAVEECVQKKMYSSGQ
jgi:hypothetical protein